MTVTQKFHVQRCFCRSWNIDRNLLTKKKNSSSFLIEDNLLSPPPRGRCPIIHHCGGDLLTHVLLHFFLLFFHSGVSTCSPAFLPVFHSGAGTCLHFFLFFTLAVNSLVPDVVFVATCSFWKLRVLRRPGHGNQKKICSIAGGYMASAGNMVGKKSTTF